MTALQLELPGLTLEVHPTAAMADGTQRIFQCSQCGTVVVQTGTTKLGTCPACQHPANIWWRQQLPVAGLHTADRHHDVAESIRDLAVELDISKDGLTAAEIVEWIYDYADELEHPTDTLRRIETAQVREDLL